jgi:hypothetical protein
MTRRAATVLADEDVVEHARTDPRPRSRRVVAPMATLAGTALALGYLAAVDPNQPGHYPLCPTRAIFGVDCPGCGLMRSTHDLVTGNVAGALDHNVLVVVLVPVAIVLWIRWFLQSWRGQSPEVTYGQFRQRNRWMVVSLVAILAFGVIRNFVPYLGSGIG